MLPGAQREVAVQTITEAFRTMTPSARPVAEIGLLIYPDCQLSAIYGLTDLFRVASQGAGYVPAALPPVEGPAPEIRVSHWRQEAGEVTCIWDSHPGQPHDLTHVIAPPSLVLPEAMQPQPVAAHWMMQHHAAGATLCSVCAGAFVLAETGLMDGRPATTHWAFAAQLAQRFPRIRLAAENMVLDDGDIVTAGGILAWTDLGLTLVERLLGAGIMLATARFFLVEPPRSSQRPYAAFVARFDHGDEAIRKAQHHLHAHASEPLHLSTLHALAGMTERTFLRRFQAATGFRPSTYLQQVRVARARESLEQTSLPIDRIAWEVGYSDVAAFRKIFQKLTAMPPSEYRQRFGIAPREVS